MPELPEVEAAAGQLRQAALGRTIRAVEPLHPALARSLPPVACQGLAGRTIAAVARRAKIQLVTLDDGQVLEVHFRMTGDWAFGVGTDPIPVTERLRIHCTDGSRVSLIDARALAVLRLHPPGELQLPPLGPEPLTEAFTVEAFREALARRRGPIKVVLLDQRVVAGVGNIYAAEALWLARIHPSRVAATLTRPRLLALRDAIRDVLATAPVGRYFASAETVAADDAHWRVYGREGAPCPRCARSIRRLMQAGRSSYYCPGCQR